MQPASKIHTCHAGFSNVGADFAMFLMQISITYVNYAVNLNGTWIVIGF